jgi:hypothetical protein
MSVEPIDAGGIFRVGPVLSRAWRLFVGDILFFLGVTILMAVPVALAIAAANFRVPGRAADYGPGVIEVSLDTILALGVGVVGQAVLLLGAFQRLRGRPLHLGEALRKALARLFPLLGLVLLAGLALGACLILSICSVWAISVMFGGGRGTVQVSPIAFVPVTAPAAILFVMWIVTVPACVVEALSPLASIIRSNGLTKGYRWKIFGIAFLLGLLLLAIPIVQLILTPLGRALPAIVGTACLLVWIAYCNCVVIMTYHDLRVAKEDILTEQIVEIFD